MERTFSCLFIIPFNDLKMSMFCKVHLQVHKHFFQHLPTLKIYLERFLGGWYKGKNGKEH